MDIHAVIISQYRAALSMLSQSVDRCPDPLWTASEHPSPFWRIAYHALFFTHLYLQPTVQHFQKWDQHQEEAELLGNLPWPPHRKAADVPPYTKEQVQAYVDFCCAQVDEKMQIVDLDGPSGFDWLPFGKFELLLYALRHLQQHIGELDERLGVNGVQIDWIGQGKA